MAFMRIMQLISQENHNSNFWRQIKLIRSKSFFIQREIQNRKRRPKLPPFFPDINRHLDRSLRRNAHAVLLAVPPVAVFRRLHSFAMLSDPAFFWDPSYSSFSALPLSFIMCISLLFIRQTLSKYVCGQDGLCLRSPHLAVLRRFKLARNKQNRETGGKPKVFR